MVLLNPKSLRRHNRFYAEMKALVLVESAKLWQPHTFWTENVSLGGMLIRGEANDYPFAVGQRLQVDLFMDEDNPGAAISLVTEIVHVKPPQRFGLKIVETVAEILEEYDLLLSRYIARHPDRVRHDAGRFEPD